MNASATAAEIRSLTCDKKLPHHEYSVTLWTEGRYRERIVRLQMTPRLYENDECLQEAVSYVFHKTVKGQTARHIRHRVVRSAEAGTPVQVNARLL